MHTLSWARPILAVNSVGPEHKGLRPAAEIVMLPPGDMGDKLNELIAQATRQHQANAVFLMGIDSPNLPVSYLEEMFHLLQHHEAVLGPCEDGGFYALALRCGKDLPRVEDYFLGVPWSCDQTLSATQAVLSKWGLRVTLGRPWFDVDTPKDLLRLREMQKS